MLVASLASAAQFAAFDRRTQVLGSELILLGEVGEVRSDWNEDRSMIVTDAEIIVEDVWKGRAPERITIRTPGGTVGTVGVHVDGAATFRSGQRLLLFLEQGPAGYRPWGMRFGVWEIVASGTDSFAVGTPPPAKSGAVRFESVSVSLEELRTEVAAALGETRQ